MVYLRLRRNGRQEGTEVQVLRFMTPRKADMAVDAWAGNCSLVQSPIPLWIASAKIPRRTHCYIEVNKQLRFVCFQHSL